MKLVFGFTLVLAVSGAPAQSIFELGTVLDGSAPTSTSPWLTATFTDAAPGDVRLTLQSHLSVPSEFIGEISFNLNPTYNPTSLSFLQLSGPLLQQSPTLSEDGVRLSGAGSAGVGFDILLNWPTGGGQNRFNDTESVSFDITGPADLTSDDFDFFNTVHGQDGEAIIGAHIQGIPAGGGVTTSGAVIQSTPEPGALAIFASALAVIALRRACAAHSRGRRA